MYVLNVFYSVFLLCLVKWSLHLFTLSFFVVFLSIYSLFIDIPIYGVLTGRDKYDPIRNEKVKENITRFREILGLPKHRFACITNYCEDSDQDMKYLNTTIPRFDVPVLRLMKQVHAFIMPLYKYIILHSSVKRIPMATRSDNCDCFRFLIAFNIKCSQLNVSRCRKFTKIE